MIYTEERIDKLRYEVKKRLGERRYKHTLGVEEAAVRLGRVFMPDAVLELRAAALLHDIAKELPTDELLGLIADNGSITEEDRATVSALHSFAGAELVRRHFPEFATEQITDAVFDHTLGGPGMCLFSEIIFIADYIEDGRTYPSCINTARFLYGALESAKNTDERLRALHRAVVMAIEYTTDSLKSRGVPVNSRTLMTKNSFEALI